MTPELEALARRAVACPRWRWMPGMLGWRPDNQGVPHSIRFVEGVESMEALAGVWPRGGHGVPGLVASGYAICDGYWRSVDITPDLTDPATLGCLLAMIREAYGSTTLYCRLSSTTRASDGIRAWEVIGWLDPSRSPNGRGGSFRGWGYASEAEALVATLEAAP